MIGFETNTGPTLAAILVGVGILVAGCSVLPLPQFAEWSARQGDEHGVEGLAGLDEPTAWWESFDDPVLNRIVEAVLGSNFDLATAVARVKQARARARIAVAARLPTVQGSLGAGGFDVPINVGLGAQLEELGLGADTFAAFNLALPDRLDQTTYDLGVDFAYEVDLWGRDRNAALSAGAERLASEADYRAARIGILA